MSALAERMAAGVTTVARAWVLRRSDGVVLGFTDHDRDLVVDGVACRASSGMTARAVESGTGLAVDNSEASGVLSDDAVSEADLRAGRWDGAAVVLYLVDWAAPEAFEVTFRGSLGEIGFGSGAFRAELRGLTEPLNAVRGRVYHARCDAVLGDARCGVDLAKVGRSAEMSVRSVDAGRFELEGTTAAQDGYFARGAMVLLDGVAEGLVERVRSDVAVEGGRAVSLWGAFAVTPEVGDRVRLEAGCDKTMATCRAKFDNALNFRGFPHIPGDDWLMAVPARRA